MNEAKLELAKRMLEAFQSPIHAFIYQRSLDDQNLIAEVVREAGLGQLLLHQVLSGKEGIYALIVNDRPCRAECSYGKCDPNDEECIARCIEECRSKRLDLIVERLREYVERFERRARRTRKVDLHTLPDSGSSGQRSDILRGYLRNA